MSGLSYYVLIMLCIVKFVCDIYFLLNRSLLYSVIILYDLGKVRELSGLVVMIYIVEGNLFGYIFIVSDEVVEIVKELGIDGEEVMLFRYMILVYYGKMEFGLFKLFYLKEVEIFYFIDNIDVKMNMFDKVFKKIEKG